MLVEEGQSVKAGESSCGSRNLISTSDWRKPKRNCEHDRPICIVSLLDFAKRKKGKRQRASSD